METQHPYGPPELTMLACGVITPTEVRTSRVTPHGFVIHECNHVPVEHHAYTPARTATGWPFWLAALFFAAWIGWMLVEIAATCAGRAGL